MKAKTLTWLLVLFLIVGFFSIPQIATYGETSEKIALNIFGFGLLILLSARIYLVLFGKKKHEPNTPAPVGRESISDGPQSKKRNEETWVDRMHRQAKDNPIIGFLIILCAVIILAGNVAKSLTEISKFIGSW